MQIDLSKCSSLWHKLPPHFYFLPYVALRSCVAHYTYFEESEMQDESSLLLVPDVSGCIVISDVGNRIECNFWGPTTNCVKVNVQKERIRFRFFIEFLPAGAYSLFHQPQASLLNVRLSLDTLLPKMNKAIIEVYEKATTLDEFIKEIDCLLLRHFLQDTTCVRSLQKNLSQDTSIKEISQRIGYSERHMQRMFQDQIGTTMKEYRRIERINRAIQYLRTTPKMGSEIAQLCGYYDQAHFIHDFKLICGVTPSRFISQMSDFYNESFKFHGNLKTEEKDSGKETFIL